MTVSDNPPRRRGRPAGSTDPDARKGSLKIRLNKKEREKIDRFAAEATLPVSEYGRRRMLKQKMK